MLRGTLKGIKKTPSASGTRGQRKWNKIRQNNSESRNAADGCMAGHLKEIHDMFSITKKENRYPTVFLKIQNRKLRSEESRSRWQPAPPILFW